ncbi:MAG: cyclic pyranopterin monophosphate synthase MoaC [Betaproteobacteria bacterium AqS2]|uniref:Cyclic pyranopterin monophosphate synthase MoaC n=1 Tax=Candidatus Amphirhobacter heronislandensis TaxID=1732024 RepID=A0A930UAY6_9GAMM|nr:cyclic pyranopterin monophosphate synthase MoaC [Betaproteobacteria bacterium AqS2]
MSEASLTHLGRDGRPRMVAVGDKPVLRRTAVARGRIRLNAEALELCERDAGAKGSVSAVATLAAIGAAKRTSDIIPLCHQLPLERVDVNFSIVAGFIVCEAEVATHAKTGVEMEALAAVFAGLLAVYDMCKAVDREMVISDVRLVRKDKEQPAG